MYNCEKTARRQNKWVSLLICWLIILGGSAFIPPLPTNVISPAT